MKSMQNAIRILEQTFPSAKKVCNCDKVRLYLLRFKPFQIGPQMTLQMAKSKESMIMDFISYSTWNFKYIPTSQGIFQYLIVVFPYGMRNEKVDGQIRLGLNKGGEKAFD